MLLTGLGSVGSAMLPAEQIEEMHTSNVHRELCNAVWLSHDPHHKHGRKQPLQLLSYFTSSRLGSVEPEEVLVFGLSCFGAGADPAGSRRKDKPAQRVSKGRSDCRSQHDESADGWKPALLNTSVQERNCLSSTRP